MGMVNGEEPRSRPCPCYLRCEDCLDFRKIGNNKDGGLAIYHRAIQKNKANNRIEVHEPDAITSTEDIFILHNTTNMEITSTEFLPVLERSQINCPRCKIICEHARQLLLRLPITGKNNTIGICDHCRINAQLQKQCTTCEDTVKTFLLDKDKQKDKNTISKAWLSKIHIFLRGPIPTADVVKSRTSSVIITDKLHDNRTFRSKPKEMRISQFGTPHSDPDIPGSFPYTEQLKEISYNLDKTVSAADSTKSLQDPLAISSISQDSDIRRIVKVIKERVSSITVPKKIQVTIENFDCIPYVKDEKPSKKIRVKIKEKELSNEAIEIELKKDRMPSTMSIIKNTPDMSSTLIKKYPSFETVFSSKLTRDSVDKQMSYFFPNKEDITDKPKHVISSTELIMNTRDMLKRETQLRKEMEDKRIHEKRKIREENAEKKVARIEEKRLAEEEVTKIGRVKHRAEEIKQINDVGDNKELGTFEEKHESFDEKYIKEELREIKQTDKKRQIESKVESKKTLKNLELLEKPLQFEDTDLKQNDTKKSTKLPKEIEQKLKNVPEIKSATEKKTTQLKDTGGKDNPPEIKDTLASGKDGHVREDKTKTRGNAVPLRDTEQNASNFQLPKEAAQVEPIRVKKTLTLTVKDEVKFNRSEVKLKEIGEKSKGKIDKMKKKVENIVKSEDKKQHHDQKNKDETELKVEVNHEISSKPKTDLAELELKKMIAQQAKDAAKESKIKKIQDSEEKSAKEQAIKKAKEISDIKLKQKMEPVPNVVKNIEEPNKSASTKTVEVQHPKHDLAILELKKLTGAQNKDAINQLKLKKIKEAEEKKVQELANKKANELADVKLKPKSEFVLKMVKNIEEAKRSELGKTEKPPTKELSMNKIKVRKPSTDDLILQLVKLKQSAPQERLNIAKNLDPVILRDHDKHKGCKDAHCLVCIYSDLEIDLESLANIELKRKNELSEVIVGDEIIKYVPQLGMKEKHEPVPILFQSTYYHDVESVLSKPSKQKVLTVPEEVGPKVESAFKINPKLPPDPEQTKGIIRYALSDRTFIDKGWTMLPTEKVVRKMNVYRMRPAHPEFDWFEHNKNKKLLHYESGETLAEFEDSGRGRWYYRNGRLALDYYDAEEINAQQRIVVYSSGEPDERGRTHPITVLAMFDYLGNGVVFDHGGKIRLKYNQTEGVVLDREIGPVSHWKWHTLNDPPVLQQVMIDTQMAHKDPDIVKLGPPDAKSRPDNEDMLAIEFDNFIKEKSKKLTQTFKPFQIKMKALKINENFSLRVLDQATVYLIYRDGTTNLKINIGMILDHKEIVDTDTAELGEVSNSLERFPARTDSLAGLQRSLAHVQRFERNRTERDRRLRPREPTASADQLTAAATRPLRPPFRTLPSASNSGVGSTCRCSRRPPTCNVYYDTRLP